MKNLSKVTVTKHGDTYIPPISELPEPFYLNCPECGETWCGYEPFKDEELCKDWRGHVIKKSKMRLGITVDDYFVAFTCPECGCEFELSSRESRYYHVSEKLFEVVASIAFLAFLFAGIIAASCWLAIHVNGDPRGTDIGYLIAKVLCLLGFVGLAALIILARLDSGKVSDDPDTST